MESIDRLREYADRLGNSRDPWCRVARDLSSIADAIEREVEQEVEAACAEAYGNGVQSVALPDMTAYAKLPVDADGVPIHVGDWITGEWDAKAKVEAVTSDDVYWWEPDGCHWCHAHEVRHHHAPTVEDVLREFAQEMNENLGMYTGEAIDADEWRKADERTIAEYAARLRLAGEE